MAGYQKHHRSFAICCLFSALSLTLSFQEGENECFPAFSVLCSKEESRCWLPNLPYFLIAVRGINCMFPEGKGWLTDLLEGILSVEAGQENPGISFAGFCAVPLQSSCLKCEYMPSLRFRGGNIGASGGGSKKKIIFVLPTLPLVWIKQPPPSFSYTLGASWQYFQLLHWLLRFFGTQGPTLCLTDNTFSCSIDYLDFCWQLGAFQ